MTRIVWLSLFGGLFALLTFWHFVVDWLLQSHNEAMRKATHAPTRARHCFIYATGFLPVMWLFDLMAIDALVCWLVLFVSHFIEDTYIPVLIWCKLVRRPPEFSEFPDDDRRAFLAFASTPLGKIIAIVVDQLVHLVFLFPIAWCALAQ